MNPKLETEKPLRGWLKNPARKERRNRSGTLTDQDVQNLIRKIDTIPEYISPVLQPKTLDPLMRLRDKAMVGLGWLWFKRAKENLGIKRKDVSVTEREILITFHIQKKRKRYKLCPNCDTRNGYKNNFCRNCKTDLQNTEVIIEGDPLVVTKRKTLKNKFTEYIIEWLNEFDKLTEDKEAWFFPALRVVFTSAYFDFDSEKPMTVQNFDRILKRLDPNMTSCLFRYGGTEKYLVLGYTPFELKEIGDWSSSKMPEIYAKRKGITAAQRRFAEDVR